MCLFVSVCLGVCPIYFVTYFFYFTLIFCWGCLHVFFLFVWGCLKFFFLGRLYIFVWGRIYSCVRIRLHTENQPPRLYGSALKVWVGFSWVGGSGGSGPTHYVVTASQVEVEFRLIFFLFFSSFFQPFFWGRLPFFMKVFILFFAIFFLAIFHFHFCWGRLPFFYFFCEVVFHYFFYVFFLVGSK